MYMFIIDLLRIIISRYHTKISSLNKMLCITQESGNYNRRKSDYVFGNVPINVEFEMIVLSLNLSSPVNL